MALGIGVKLQCSTEGRETEFQGFELSGGSKNRDSTVHSHVVAPIWVGQRAATIHYGGILGLFERNAQTNAVVPLKAGKTLHHLIAT